MQKSLKRILQTGKVELGSKKVLSNLQEGKCKLVIISNNCPKEIKEDLTKFASFDNIPVVIFNGTSLEFGEFCGKPFLVAAISVTDLGKVILKDFLKEAKQ